MADYRTERLAGLRDKLKARTGKPGMASNVEAIQAQIADLEAAVTYRDKASGAFVSIEYATQNPETTERV